jgi:cell wall-associated NlpC family hydrolase
VRRNARALCGAAVALATVLGLGGAAIADDPGPAYPSRQQVDRAQADVTARQGDLAGVRTEYAAAQAAAAAAVQRAEIAAEAYNGAMWKLSLAREAAATARRTADAAAARVAAQRAGIARLVVQSYQEGTSLNTLTALLGADGPESVMGRTSVVDMAGASLRADYDRYTRLSAAAQDAEDRAAAAETASEKVAARARAARTAASAAARRATDLRAAVATRRDTVINALAAAEHTSVALATARQAALDEIARKKAAAEARRKAELAAQREKQREQERQKRAEEQARNDAQQQQAQQGSSDGSSSGGSGSSGSPGPGTSAPPQPSGGAAAAIAFAKAQLGEPYRWGAAGPSRWDCSGLTMMAWRAGGIALPHFSGAQYGAGTPVPVSQAQPGDLLFWTSNGRPGGIHHVALYVGGGSFIEAPHAGASVRYNSLDNYYPDFAVRL